MEPSAIQSRSEENERLVRDFIEQLKISNNLVKVEEKLLATSKYEIIHESDSFIRINLTIDDKVYWEHIDNIDIIENKVRHIIESKLNYFELILSVNFQKSPMKIEETDNSRVKIYETALPPDTLKRIWGENHAFKIFISHKDNCKADAEALQTEFAKYGISCFVAHVDIEPSQDWALEIKNALFSCDACLALMSKEFHKSNWTDQEVGCCLGRNIPVFPIIWRHRDENHEMQNGIPPYGVLGSIQALHYNGGGMYPSLVTEIMKYLLQNEVVQNAFIREILYSENYNMANHLASLFEYIPSLKPYQIDNAISNWKNNSQTKEAFAFSKGGGVYGKGFAYYLKKWRKRLLTIDRTARRFAPPG